MEIGKIRSLCMKPVLLPVLVGILSVCACSNEDAADMAQERTQPLPDQVISDFKITETSMGKKDWSMEAEEAYIYEKRNILEARTVKVTFFDTYGDVRSILQADYGKLNRNSDDMEARGSVVVTGSDGVVLETESLVWQSTARRIVSDDSVKIIRNEDVLTGWGFSGDPDLGSFSILRGMRATIRPKQQTTEGGRSNVTGAKN